MSAPARKTRARAAAGVFVVDPRSSRFALPAEPGTLPLAFSLVSARSAMAAGPSPHLSPRQLGVRSLSPRAFTDAALSAAHAQLDLLFAAPDISAMRLAPIAGLWGRAARHGLAPDRNGLTFLGRSLFALENGTRWHLRLFAIPVARAVQALFPATSGARPVWLDESELESCLRVPELLPFIPLAKAAASGMLITPLQVRNQAGRLHTTRL